MPADDPHSNSRYESHGEIARGESLGERMFRWASDRAREKGCRIVQLTSNKARDRALAFYEKLGYEPSHVGFKLYLD